MSMTTAASNITTPSDRYGSPNYSAERSLIARWGRSGADQERRTCHDNLPTKATSERGCLTRPLSAATLASLMPLRLIVWSTLRREAPYLAERLGPTKME